MYLQESSGKAMSKILLVITTYNQSHYTKLCFESLKKLDDNIDVLVVDDYSTDDTVDICKEYGHRVITKDEPKGLTDSWNIGYREFLGTTDYGTDYDYFILANNDILIPKGAIGELVSTFKKWNSSLVVPMSTEYGVGHNLTQNVNNYYHGLEVDEPEDYQRVQDEILKVKEEMRDSNNLYLCDPVRMKMFNGFFFMMNRDITIYEQNDDELFKTDKIMTKNEDQFNWDNLITNDDFSMLCKTSFVFHYKGVSTFKVFDNYNKISNDVSEWKRQRELRGG